MPKTLSDDVLDGSLNVVKNNATQLCVCNAQPTTYNEATSTYKLAIKTGLTSLDYTGPADHTSGRKLTVNEQTGLTVGASDNAVYIALCGTASGLYVVTTCTSQTVTAGNTVNVPAWNIILPDPT